MTISLASKWRSEHRIVKLAYFDALTGLPNREQSRNRLASALAAAKQHGRDVAVLYLDLDNFKRVNDTLGHAVGDELLCLVASRMRDSLRADDGAAADDHPSPRTNHIARLGGDEFIVILPGIRAAADAAAVACAADRRAAAADASGDAYAGDHAQHRNRPVPDRRRGCRHAAPQCRSRHVFREAQGSGDARFLQRRDERCGAASIHAGGEAARRPGARRIHAELPAAVRREHGRDFRHGGAAALEERRSGPGGTGRIHPDRRGDGIDPVDRRVGAPYGVPPGEALARRGIARGAHGGERVRAAVRRSRNFHRWWSRSFWRPEYLRRCSSSRSPNRW